MAEVQRCADSEGDCDCERLYLGVVAAIAAMALAVAVGIRSKAVQRVAGRAVEREIRRLRRSEAESENINEWLQVRRELKQGELEADTMVDKLERTLTIMRALEQDAFSGGAGTIRIIP